MSVYIRHQVRREYYSVTEREFRDLARGANSNSKDLCLVLGSIAIATLLNAVNLISSQSSFALTLSIFLNSAAGLVSFVLGIGYGLAWRRVASQRRRIVKEIESRPLYELDMDCLTTAESHSQATSDETMQTH